MQDATNTQDAQQSGAMLQQIITFLGPAASTAIVAGLSYLAWGILSGIINTAIDKFTPHSDPEWAAYMSKHKVLGGLVSFLRTAGFNVAGGIRSIAVWAGKMPKPVEDVLQTSRVVTPKDIEDIVKRSISGLMADLRQLDPMGKAANVHVDVSHSPAVGEPSFVTAKVAMRDQKETEVEVGGIVGNQPKIDPPKDMAS